jgi:hypothetical protein
MLAKLIAEHGAGMDLPQLGTDPGLYVMAMSQRS